jgi:protein tyrosine phosphatase
MPFLNSMITHCSAGIGRTGVYIMLELGLLHFQTSLSVDLPAMLTGLRSQRMGLVQTEVGDCLCCVQCLTRPKDQYKFLYATLARIRREEGPHFKIVPRA